MAQSCKKELFEPSQTRAQAASKIQDIKYAEFMGAVNASGIGSLKKLLAPINQGGNGQKLMSTNATEHQFKIDRNAVKKVVLGDTVSYVVSLKPETPRAVQFRNLTVQVVNNKTTAFLTTYLPTQEWVKNWRSKKKLGFKGKIYANKIDLSDISKSNALKGSSQGSKGVIMAQNDASGEVLINHNKISLAPGECETYDVYETVMMPCKNGHYSRSDCDYQEHYGDWDIVEGRNDWPPYEGLRYVGTALNCAPPDMPAAPGGGGGATTPTPPTNYDPCPGGAGAISYANVYGGLKLAVAAGNPCDGDGSGLTPLPVNPAAAAIQNLILNLPITDYAQQQYLYNNPNVAISINNYLNTNGFTPENKEFAIWAIVYLMGNLSFDYHLFFDENEFSGINNPPVNITEEALINNGIKIGEVPDNAPQNQNRIIGGAPKRHGNNSEDLQYGTNGNTSGILSSMINKPSAQLFSSMRSLLWQTSILSPEMRTITSQMADKFESNTGGTFENAILTKNVKKSVNYQNFLKKFGEEFGKQLTETSGNINQIPEIKTNDYRPKFNGVWNKFGGLQIAINDTEANEVKLLNFRTEAWVLWYADVTIYDNFGLDKHDALIYQGKHAGFAAWWLLQHTRGFKPFVTKIVIKSSIEGRY